VLLDQAEASEETAEQEKQQETPMKSSRTTNSFPPFGCRMHVRNPVSFPYKAPGRLVIMAHSGTVAHLVATTNIRVSKSGLIEESKMEVGGVPAGTTMMMIKIEMPIPSQMRIFMSCIEVSTQKSGIPTKIAYLPPHCLADSVGSPTEALSGCRQVIGLILESIEAFATLRDLVNVVSHHTNSVINLLNGQELSAIMSPHRCYPPLYRPGNPPCAESTIVGFQTNRRPYRTLIQAKLRASSSLSSKCAAAERHSGTFGTNIGAFPISFRRSHWKIRGVVDF